MPSSTLIGTSYRKARLLRDHYGRDGDILMIRAPSNLLDPTLDQAIIDEAFESDPAAAKAEWLAEFRDDIGGWAERGLIEAAVEMSSMDAAA